VVGVKFLASGQPDGGSQGKPAHLAQRLADGGERRRQQRGDLGVIETDDAEVLGNPEPPDSRGLDDTRRDLVGGGEHRRRPLRQIEEDRSTRHAGLVVTATASL